jgi:N-methylhydantoinase A
MRVAVDTGGTFTDVVVEDARTELRLFKTATTPDDPIRGVLVGLAAAARGLDLSLRQFLAETELLIHGTTRATNAILTETTARTAFLTTEGHPDVLVFREGGRAEPFNFTQSYPEPYIPRSLTYEIPGRIGSSGEIVAPLEEEVVLEIIKEMKAQAVDAIGVCLLWSIANPAHELRVGELLEQHLVGVPFTLSHRLNPTIREYRRASATVIDASLKPLMTAYLSGLGERLWTAGFRGQVLVVTSSGGVLDSAAVASAPIHSIGSGPAMAPVAGRYYAKVDSRAETAVVADAGGTSYDVSVVRRGRVPFTRETWLGRPYLGHMTGFPSIDVKSIGAGGGSVAWVDAGGMLHVGPKSAGAVPGPACYGRGGSEPTVTDASLVLGYIDPAYFLGGAMALDVEAAEAAIQRNVGDTLRLSVKEAAAAILTLTTENMVGAIEEITLKQGIDPRTAVLVGGGGAAGFNAIAIARRLGFPQVIIPDVAPALSAAGALMSDLLTTYSMTYLTGTNDFAFTEVNAILQRLENQCDLFIADAGARSPESQIEFFAEARYPHQVWELEVPLGRRRFAAPEDVESFREDFHQMHLDVFAVSDPESPVEIVNWHARARCRLWAAVPGTVRRERAATTERSREVYFPATGAVQARVRLLAEMTVAEILAGPVIVEAPATTVVVNPGSAVEYAASGSLMLVPFSDETQPDTFAEIHRRGKGAP